MESPRFCVFMVMILLGEFLGGMAEDNCTITDYGLKTSTPGISCADIYSKNPASRGNSGEYIIKTDRLYFVYCDMELDCKGHKGWMRIADLNTTKGDDCPDGWVKNTTYKSLCTGGVTAGCYSANFSTIDTHYTKVCGQMKGYQKGSTDAFYPHAYAHGNINYYKPDTVSRALDGVYVDGVSITTTSPRKHIWTYAVGTSDDHKDYLTNCPCAVHPGPSPPVYVGQDYYCESGTTGEFGYNSVYYDDPLWDGKQCTSENGCCSQADAPWFFRHFITKQYGSIEIRICRDQAFSDEGVGIEQLQLFVQ